MKKIYNTDYLEKSIFFESNNAEHFSKRKKLFERLGYKIKNIVLTDDGKFKLIGNLTKKKSLVKCILKDKEISENDRVYPHSLTYPELCEFYKNGICCCVDHSFCLYQETKNNTKIVKEMVKEYNSDVNKNKEYNNCSKSYEDTTLGRIFSRELSKDNYYRHIGN